MKIAFFTDTFLPQINGVVSSLTTIAGALGRKGYKIVIFAPKPARGKEVNWKSENVEIHFLSSVKTFIYHDFRAAVPISPKLLQSIRQTNPDIIHFQTTFFLGGGGILLGKLLKKPVIGSFHGYFMEPEYLKIVKLDYQVSIISNILWKYVALFYNQCDAVLTYSKGGREDLEKHGVKKPIFVIPNTINEKKMKKVSKEKISQLRELYNLNKKVVLYIGRISAEKSLDTLVESFSYVLKRERDTSLLIIGDGPTRNSIMNLCGDLRIKKNVVLTGNIPQEELLTRGYFQVADVFATASKSELQPVSIIEAMYFGLPIVGVGKRGVLEMVQRVGLISTPDKSQELAENILKILQDERLRKRLSKNSQLEFTERYMLSKVTKSYESFYRQVVKDYRKERR